MLKLLNFTKSGLKHSPIQTERLILRAPAADDYRQWADLRQKSADFLKPYEPKWTVDELSRASFSARLRRQHSDRTSGRALTWFLMDADDATLLGGISLSNIRRGIADTGTFGYWMGEPFAGQGFMSEAVMAISDHAFSTLDLHRLEAATLTDNERSQRLLCRCGFHEEGLARHYLKINGEWRDHILFAKLTGD